MKKRHHLRTSMPKPARASVKSGRWRAALPILSILVLGVMIGCAPRARNLKIIAMDSEFRPGTIVDTAARRPIDFADLIAALEKVRVVYVGETHTHPGHHAIQRRVIEALAARRPDLAVGMEMFDRTYQPVLDRWRRRLLEEKAFLEQSHWYANWRYPFRLYREILETVRRLDLRPVALNIPFHIPPKIAVGGLSSIFGDDARHLPRHIDTTVAEHRRYVSRIFEMHHSPGITDFEKFYQAQCVWEEAMAEAVTAAAVQNPVVVLAGGGHIIEKFGIPNRVFARNHAPFLTLLPVAVGQSARLTDADYLWVTAAPPRPGSSHAP